MIDNAIKSVGTHRVSVRLHPEVVANLDVESSPADLLSDVFVNTI